MSSLKLGDSDWLSMFLQFIGWKKRSKSDSNHIVPLCYYHYSCGVKLERLLKCYCSSYLFTCCSWCERRFKRKNSVLVSFNNKRAPHDATHLERRRSNQRLTYHNKNGTVLLLTSQCNHALNEELAITLSLTTFVSFTSDTQIHTHRYLFHLKRSNVSTYQLIPRVHSIRRNSIGPHCRSVFRTRCGVFVVFPMIWSEYLPHTMG